MSAIAYKPMTTIKLSGSLAQKFGRTHRRQLDSGDTWEVFKALKATLAGFEDEVRRLDGMGLRFAVFRNRQNVGLEDFERGGVRELRIVPVIGGSKRGGCCRQSSAWSWWLPALSPARRGRCRSVRPWRLVASSRCSARKLRGCRRAQRRRTGRPMPSAARITPPPAETPCRSASVIAGGVGRSYPRRFTPRTKAR